MVSIELEGHEQDGERLRNVSDSLEGCSRSVRRSCPDAGLALWSLGPDCPWPAL